MKLKLITFQPRSILNKLTSDNFFLEDYKDKIGYTPIFAVRIDDVNTELALVNILFSFPRNPEIGVIFEVDEDEAEYKVLSKIDVFRFDSVANLSEANSVSNLAWQKGSAQGIDEIIDFNYKGHGLKDYIVPEIKRDSILGIYDISKSLPAKFDNTYKYNNIKFMQWVIEYFIGTAKEHCPNINNDIIPLVDLYNNDFNNVIQVIYNQLVFRPFSIDSKDLMKFENIVEQWLFGSTSPESKKRKEDEEFFLMKRNTDFNIFDEEIRTEVSGDFDIDLDIIGYDIPNFEGNNMNINYAFI